MFFDMHITKMTFMRPSVLMKQEKLCMIRKETILSRVLKICYAFLKDQGESKGFQADFQLKTEKIYILLGTFF